MADFNTLRIDLIRRLSLCGAWDGKLYWYKDTIQLLKKMMQFVPPTTNADRIRSMTDEELAEWLAKQKYKKPTFDGWLPLCNNVMGPRMCHEDGCEKCWIDWLKQENETN